MYVMVTGVCEDKRYRPHMDFISDGITYRYDVIDDKFSKLYSLPGDWSKAIRGKKRAALLQLVRQMYAAKIKYAVLI